MQTFVSTIEHITIKPLADSIKLLAKLAAEPQGRGPVYLPELSARYPITTAIYPSSTVRTCTVQLIVV